MTGNFRWQATRRRLGVVAVLAGIMLLFCLFSDRPGDLEAGLIGAVFGLFFALLVELVLWLRKPLLRSVSQPPLDEDIPFS